MQQKQTILILIVTQINLIQIMANGNSTKKTGIENWIGMNNIHYLLTKKKINLYI